MARIKMKNTNQAAVREIFSLFLSAAAAKGLKEKTVKTYQQHFQSISKRLNVEISIADLKKTDLNQMILQMRKESFSVLLLPA